MTATEQIPSTAVTSSRATALLHVVDLEARWSNLQPGQPGASPSLIVLNEKQRAYESFRLRLASYQARYSATYESEPLLGNPMRLAAWCLAMRGLCLEAAAEGSCPCPSHLMAKAYRVAERAGLKTGETPPRSESAPVTVLQAAEELESLARWFESLARAASRPARIPA